MSLHRVCCCGGQCTGCDFASSYTMQIGQLTGTWLYTWNGSPCCVGNTETAVVHDVIVTITVTFSPADVLTRRSTGTIPDGCCYYCDSSATVDYDVTITDRGACCNDTNPCEVVNNFTGSIAVPFCHTVVPQVIDGTCKWLHTTALCNFIIGEQFDVLNSLAGLECGRDPLDCENLPLDRVDIWLSGARWQWSSDYVALDSLSGLQWLGFCENAQPCTADDPSCDQNVTYGAPPFSISYMTTYDGPRPDYCYVPEDIYGGIAYWMGSTWDCGGNPSTNTDWCYTEWNITGTGCDCSKEFSFISSGVTYS